MLKEIVKRAIALATIGALAPMITVPFVKWEISAVNLSQDAVLQKYSIEDLKATQAFILNAPYDGNGRVIDAYEDGRIDCFDMVMLRKMYSEQTQKTGSFYSLSSDMVHDNDAKYGTMIMSDEFYSKRVIVKADTSYDFSDFSPKEVINGPDNLYVLQFETVENAELSMNALRKDEHIEYVELDEYMSCGEIESEQANANSWGVSGIEADQYAEYLGNNYNSSVVVAVVDTGVASHDFLKGRLLDTGYDLVDNDPNPNDKHYHGTHVAGTVVDCTPKLNINIMPVRVLDEYGNGSNLNVGNGIRYATEHGADVINLSLGGEGCSKYIDDSIAYAVDNGVTVVVAAGNEGDNTVHYCPAHVENCIVVAACNSNNEKANFSNYGNSVDVIAPGVDIKSCIPGGSYKSLNGTSMATPHISAAAAMIKYAEPNITPAEIEQKIKDVSLDLGDKGKDVYFGYGLPKLSNLIKDNPNIKPSITISETELSMVVGDNKLLTAQTVPSGQTVSWKSSNEKVSTVENGNVKVISAGTAKITASFEYNGNSYSAECSVKVTDNSGNIVEEGQCGDDVYYTLDGNGLLNITGKGEMWDYNLTTESGSNVFWSSANSHDESPFKLNDKIKNVIVNEGVTYIGECTFPFCTNLKNISLPDTLITMKQYAFYDCDLIEEIYIPKNVKYIGEISYENNEGTDIRHYADCASSFSKCNSLKNIKVNENNPYFSDDNGVLISADKIIAYYVPLGKTDYVITENIIYLADGFARDHTEITEFAIPSTVKWIGEDAFVNCSNLQNIQLNRGVEIIGSRAFEKTALKSVDIPNTVQRIGSGAFEDCYYLESLTFEKYGFEPLTIGVCAFSDCSKLKSVELHERITCISNRAFYDCYNLEYVKVMGYNTAISPDGDDFGDDINRQMTLGTKNTLICGYGDSTAEQYATESGRVFLNVDKNFIIPTSGMFGDGLNWELTNGTLTISGNGEIPKWESHSWSSRFVEFDNYLPPWWVHRNSIKKIIINKGITKIGEKAFILCKNLETISIPDTVEAIESEFIDYSTIKEVTIPESVTTLEQLALYGVDSLEKLTILNPNCSFGWTMNKYMVPETTVIYGYKNSTAQTYAEKYNRTFIALD